MRRWCKPKHGEENQQTEGVCLCLFFVSFFYVFFSMSLSRNHIVGHRYDSTQPYNIQRWYVTTTTTITITTVTAMMMMIMVVVVARWRRYSNKGIDSYPVEYC